MTVRYTKSEIAARKTAEQTLADPSASIQAKYLARLTMKSTKQDASRRAEKKVQRPDAPVVVHRSEVPVDPNLRRFMDALEAMLEHQNETVTAEASPETPVASDQSQLRGETQ